ncbi:MAG: hypothetical protein JNK32_04920 [Anaerolineales bacterium]|nr:hypothetical protein [Anaerolineales bacterium]
MQKSPRTQDSTLELLISLAVVLVLLLYTYGILIAAPYQGFYFNPTSGVITSFYGEGTTSLQEGDILERIGDITLKQFKADRRLVFFEGVQPGDIIEIAILRNGKPLVVQWVFPGFNLREFTSRLFNSWMLAYIFWLAGLAAQLLIRPRDLRRRLFVIANYLVALFLVSGALSSWHLWESSTLLHALTWLMMPVFLHLHWVFPRPIRNLPNLFWSFLYGVAFLLAAGEILHMLGRNLYALGFAIALLGSILLLFAHLFIQKEERQTIRLLLLSILIAFSASIAVAIAQAFGVILNLGWFTVYSMPFMPLAYFYLINRRQLGGMETRVNSIISTYTFLILLGLAFFILLVSFAQTSLAEEAWVILAPLLAFVASITTAVYLPRFQTFLNQRLFGIKLPYQNLTQTYSSRIAVSTTLPSLLALLKEQVFPSLLIRQYVFLKTSEKNLSVLLAQDIPEDSFDFDSLTQKAGHYIPNLPPDEGWLRLILPLKLGDVTLGFWLLGKRDPDDLYPLVEIPILQSLADQTAIALSNILQAEQLRSLYQSDIEQIEYERKRISRDLHDDVLNQLAAMRNSLNQKTLPPAFLSTYDDLKQRLRHIINDLRPPMLDQGLAYALTEYVEDLREKNNDVRIVLDLQASEEKLPEKIEEHFFHIVREACENALRHAHARTLTVAGTIAPDHADLSIEDDGDGFDVNTDLNVLRATSHFGLLSMKERTHLAGAEINFQSDPKRGTKIQILWNLEK